MFRNGFRCVLLVTFITVISGIFCSCGLAPEADDTLAPPLIQPKRNEYQIYKVAKKDLSTSLTGSASLISQKEESLYYRQAGGRISKIAVEVGAQVKKGDVLIMLENGDLESRLKTQKNLAVKAEIQLNSLKKEYDTFMSLDKSYQPTPKEMEDKQTNIRLQQIDLDNLRISVDELSKEFSDSMLLAPFDGVVTFLEAYKEGDTVDAYKSIVTVADQKDMELYFQSNTSTDIKDVRIGMKATATLNGEKYEGEVVLSPDNAPKDALDKYKNAIIMKFNSLPKGLKWGDFMEFEIVTQTKKNVLSVPKTAVMGLQTTDRYVYLLDGDSKKQVSIDIGLQTPFDVEVKSGLSEGQSVIIN